MLREHFRCVPAIIEYSRREHYEYEIRPLRIPRSSERLDPPLVDVRVDGYRDGHRNRAEAAFIVEEIKAIVSNGAMNSRSIGVVSLLGGEQADTIWDQLKEELGPEVMQRHNITCGDAREFQGKERSIMFLSMVIAPNNLGIALGAKDTFRQRFNVAASRAQDRMYLVRSVDASQLSNADTLRKGLLGHFDSPFQQDEQRASDMRGNCESEFEKDVYDCLVERGFRVVPQVKVGRYRIDMVVEGHNDTRLAIECDGDRYHGPDKWEDDMSRQRDLERAGWRFWRCFASTFVRRREETIADLVATLTRHGVEPIGAEGAPQSIHVERRRVPAATGQTAHGE